MFKWLEKNLPKIVMAPAVGLIGWFVYGFVLWTLYISFTNSKILPKYELWGFGQYEKLWASRKWLIAVDNLLIFTALFLIFCVVIGIILAIFLDQKIRAEGLLRTIYLYPMALSFIVTGTAWKWILNPTLGIQKMFRDWGFENFTFDWLVDREMAIYTIVIAGVWQSAGFVMALFLAGLRSVEDEIVKAAKIDGASEWDITRFIRLPLIKPIIFLVIIFRSIDTLKIFDLVWGITGGGPGISTEVVQTYSYRMAFGFLEMSKSMTVMVIFSMVVFTLILIYSKFEGKSDE